MAIATAKVSTCRRTRRLNTVWAWTWLSGSSVENSAMDTGLTRCGHPSLSVPHFESLGKPGGCWVYYVVCLCMYHIYSIIKIYIYNNIYIYIRFEWIVYHFPHQICHSILSDPTIWRFPKSWGCHLGFSMKETLQLLNGEAPFMEPPTIILFPNHCVVADI